MAREAETTAFQRMMELMLAMKQDDKIREERREREVKEREAQREERSQIQTHTKGQKLSRSYRG